MAREAEPIVRGAPQRAHAEEWRQTEPLDEAEPSVVRPDGAQPRPAGRDIEHRSELARLLTRDCFPADPAALTAKLEAVDASADLTDRVSRLPGERTFASVHEVLEALGINAPEQGGRR
jgi:hypothetical protein